MGRFKPFGFRCKICDHYAKELHNCDLSFEGKVVHIMLCHRCMRRVGLKEKNPVIGEKND